ncbi:MAG: ribbon-helix-helix domain-containing protein [Ruminococcus sp.]|nr:ribbon-helix-helix domain-containing protein [Ruminococcus sp.]
MKKSVYSIVLMDEVVDAIDELAVRQGTSRSNLINQILAQHVCCLTPEMQMQSVFAVMEEQMNRLFRIEAQASEYMLSMHSALRYKYRPSLKYSVELMREPTKQQLGWLKISCRTQSKALLIAMDDFFRFWISMEKSAYPIYGDISGMYSLAPGRMIRCLLRNDGQTSEETGDAISRYIGRFDELIQMYFSGMQEGIPVEILKEETAEKFNQSKTEVLL